MKLVLPLPPTLNSTYKIGRYRNMYKAKHATDWEVEALNDIRKQIGSFKTIEGKCWITIKMLITHERDIDSSIKILLDCLQKGKIYLNDRLVGRLSIMKIKVKVNPRVEVEVGENGKKG